jgi:hypothetical protein
MWRMVYFMAKCGRGLIHDRTKMHRFTLGFVPPECCICRIFKLLYVTLMMCLYDVDTNIIVADPEGGENTDVTIRNFDGT